MFKLVDCAPPIPKPVLLLGRAFRTLRLPFALRFLALEGVCSMSDKSKLAGGLAGAGATGAGLGELLNKHIMVYPSLVNSSSDNSESFLMTLRCP